MRQCLICSLWIIAISTGWVGCQTPEGAKSERDVVTYHFTGWPKKSVDRLLQQFLLTKEFLLSEDLDGTRQYDRKGSNWDHLKYGSFLEPTAWLRIIPSFTEDKDTLHTTLRVEIEIVTDRLSRMEEKRRPRKRHMEEVRILLDQFEMLMLQPASMDPVE